MGAALAIVALSLAQAPIGKAELALAREKLERSKKDFSKEQWLLLNGKLTEAEAALAELAAVGGESAVVAAEGTAAVWTALETLPLFLMLLPATAHAPGIRESPAKRAARTKYEEKLRELAQAAQLVESQQVPAVEAKLPPNDDEDCFRIGEGGGRPERFCRYQCGNQFICVRVPEKQNCPDGRGDPLRKTQFRKLARLPRCPPSQNPN